MMWPVCNVGLDQEHWGSIFQQKEMVQIILFCNQNLGQNYARLAQLRAAGLDLQNGSEQNASSLK